MPPRRALAVIRLSHLTDATTSPGTQRQVIKREESDELEIVAWAEDLNISAADLAPAERPKLGPWLTDPEKIAQYDVIIWAKMDRAIRSVVDLYWLLDFCKRERKEIIFAKDKLDTTTPVGRIVATLLAAVGEIEIANMVERRERASEHLRTTNRWPGGPAPYGYKAVDAPDGKGKVLELSGPEATIAREIVGRVITGESREEIARDLNDRNIPTSRTRAKPRERNTLEVKGWSSAVLGRMLRSRALLGQKEQQVLDANGKATDERRLLLDPSGNPIQMAEPLITLEDFGRLQAALDLAAKPQPRGKKPNPLAGILLCGECQRPLRHHGAATRPEHTHAFRCYGDGCRAVKQYKEVVWSGLNDVFMATLGDAQVMRRVYVPGEDHTAELEDVKKRTKSLRDARYVRGEFDGEEDEWDALMSALRARRIELEALPQRAGAWTYVPEERTYGAVWQASDPEARGDLLKRSGIKVWLMPTEGRRANMRLEIPDDLLERLGVGA
ncbi:recombinase family protein [Dactylosporangium sp. CA-139066]|uniref:recombinase family protein n=1 Tax=Dactylosporangium sp. CA-139066 TaxID=3239930 RepID=UPI003D929413